MNAVELRFLGALAESFLIVAVLGPVFIPLLHRLKFGQSIRDVGPASHQKKSGTPTMGGIMIFLGILVSVLSWCQLAPEIIVALLLTLGYGLIGFLDDYIKVVMKRNLGLTAKQKFALQILLALIVLAYVTYKGNMIREILWLPGTSIIWDIGWGYYVLAVLVLVGTTNAVNLTDGLDGLAIVPVMMAAGAFGIISYLVGNFLFADYLQVHHVPGAGELAIFCAAIIGGGMGFLWYNAPPAKIFMGDTGSLALGGALGAVAVATKHELVLGIVGGLFVVEAASVMIQVGYFKLTGKRIFLMAPIHHHFEKMGWPESTVVIRFWIVAAMLALLGLATLKLR